MFFQATDDQLMERVAKGDSKAFQGLFDRYGARLLGYCRRFMGDSTRGEDMAQDVWMKVIKAASGYRAEGKFLAWLLSTARNTCLSEMRRASGKFEVPSEDIEEQNEMPAASAHDFEMLMDQKHNLDLVKRKIEALPQAQRLVLTMAMSEDLSYEQIAKELELSLAAVKSLLFRARQTLLKSVRVEQ